MREAPSALWVEFTTEELLALSGFLDLPELPGLGSNPLPDASPEGRTALGDGARRALAARGVLAPASGREPVTVEPGVARLIGALARPGLLVSAVRQQAGTEECRYFGAEPGLAVEHRVLDEVHRLGPFDPADLVSRVLEFLDLGDLRADDPLERLEFAVSAVDLRVCGEHVAAGHQAAARQSLTNAGVDPTAAAAFVAALVNRVVSGGVVVVHRPDETALAGGELAWIDGGTSGLWVTPLLDGDDSDEVANSAREVVVHSAAQSARTPVAVRLVSATELTAELASFLPAELVGSPRG